MKRVFLFVLTNLAVLLVATVVLGVVVRLLGVDPGAVGAGEYTGLLIFAAIFGMGGAFISLAMSKWSAKRITGAQVITEPRSDAEQWLVATVARHAQASGIGMPEVAIFDSPQPNAFATGARRDKALVAVSTGLLRGMNKNEVDAVLGHEISHVANGDMVTLTLIQGVLNTFVIFLSRIVGEIIDRAVFRNDREGRGIGYFLTVMVLQLAFGILASMIVFWFSRRREFRADSGGARLAGRENMISALERLKGTREEAMPEQLRAFGIAGDPRGIARLFMTHPPIEERIEALRAFQG
jgi:heat shock protein HtpX